jgi:hypothetical protein
MRLSSELGAILRTKNYSDLVLASGAIIFSVSEMIHQEHVNVFFVVIVADALAVTALIPLQLSKLLQQILLPISLPSLSQLWSGKCLQQSGCLTSLGVFLTRAVVCLSFAVPFPFLTSHAPSWCLSLASGSSDCGIWSCWVDGGPFF